MREKHPSVGECNGRQFVVARSSRPAHAVADATPRGGDLFVRRAHDAQFVLGGTPASEDRVRVGVDEPGRDRHTAGVDADRVRVRPVSNFRRQTDGLDDAVPDEDRAVRDDRRVGQFVADARTRGSRKRQDLGGVLYEQRGHACDWSTVSAG